jgi:hypothetical protein
MAQAHLETGGPLVTLCVALNVEESMPQPEAGCTVKSAVWTPLRHALYEVTCRSPDAVALRTHLARWVTVPCLRAGACEVGQCMP